MRAMAENSGHWQARPTTEDITAVACPRCAVPANTWCDRSGDKLSKRGLALQKAGTPPSHQERMWIRQGHDVEHFPSLLAKQRPGRWDESAPRANKSPRRPNGRADRAARAVQAARGSCAPCQREREFRAWLNAPGFPVDFPCRHPKSALKIAAFPRRYMAERWCAECHRTGFVEVAAQSPQVTGYRCGAGHKWLAAA